MSETTLKARLVHPCKTDAEWASSNPVAKKGEIMISSDKSGMFKVGNGTSKWNELGYNHVTWANVEGKPSTYPATAHTHDDRYYTESEIDGKLAKYLPKSGGTMEGTAFISWPDTGNWSNSNTGVTFPVSRGGLQWSGQSDGIQLYAVETGGDNLELYLKFLDDNSNGLSIRNAKGNETARISASGVISASSFIGTLTGDITGHAYGVRDYNNSKNIIQIGYSGDGLTTANLSHIAGYTDNGTKIKDVSKEVLRSWIGLGSAAYTNSDSYAPSSHTHDDRYYTETEINDKVTALNNSIATKVTEKTITTATDFNTFTTTGIYHICVSTNSNLHAPTANHGTLIVDFSVGTPYQIWMPDNNMTAQYKRTYSSSTWSGWTTQKLTDTVYTHPSYTAYTSGLYKITTNSLGHVTSATAVTKGDITALGIPGSDTNTWRGIQNNLTSDSTSDSLAAAQGKALKGMVDAVDKKVDGLEIGGRNLFRSTGVEHTNNDYMIWQYAPGNELLAEGEMYTVSMCITPGKGVSYVMPHLSHGNMGECYLYVSGNEKQVISGTFKCRYLAGMTPEDNIYNAYLQIYRLPNNGTVTSNTTIHWIKVEKGNKPTDWTPAPEDIDDSISSLSSRITTNTNSISSLKTTVSNKLDTSTFENYKSHTHKYVIDSGNSSYTLSFAYSKAGMNYGDYSWLAGWNGYELRAVNKNQFATSGHNHDSVYSKLGHTHTKSQITDFPTLGTAASKNTRTLTSVSHSSWTNVSTDQGYVPDMAFITYWNGAYSSNGASNLAYCNRGAFGTIVTKNAGDYASAGHTHSYAGSSSVGGSANSAVKLTTARNIKVGGLSNFSFNFDGSGNISVDNWGYGTNKYVTTNSVSAPYFRIAYTETKNGYTDASMILMIDGGNTGGGFGILKVAFRSDNISTVGHSYVELLWLVRKNFELDQFFVKGYNPANETQYADLYFKASGTYNGVVVTALSMGARGSKSRSWTFDSGNPRSAADIREYSYTTTSSDAGITKTCTGNASTATKLVTARSINGTNFDGSGNITTANWGTARTITIGNTGKSVNGGGNVSWSLSEIGAAASSHSHNYAGSSSAGGSATSAVKLDTATAGSATQPVYFSGGKPVACTYTLGKSVPSNAVFTDTNTWRGIQNNLTSDSTSDSLSAAQGKVLKGLVDGKANTSHTHTKSQITDFPSSLPASDVYAWAKASSKPSYSWGEITGKPSSFTPSSHTHSSIVTIGDKRDTATTPNDYKSAIIFQGLKVNNKIGIPSTNDYSYVLGLRGWNDSSGGQAHELAFNDSGIFARRGGTTSWNGWDKILTSAGYIGEYHFGATQYADPVNGMTCAIKVCGNVAMRDGEMINTYPNSFRSVYGNYGAFYRNDGSDYYLMLTKSGDSFGTWNNLRPFTVNLASGRTSIGNGLFVSNGLTINGNGINWVSGACQTYVYQESSYLCFRETINNGANYNWPLRIGFPSQECTQFINLNNGVGFNLLSGSSWKAITPTPGSGTVALGTSENRWTNLYLTGTVASSSDEKMKNIISGITEPYEKLFLKLNPILYTWKNNDERSKINPHDRIHCGLGARETERHAIECGLDTISFAAVCKSNLKNPLPEGRTDDYSIAYSELHGLEIHMIQKNYFKLDNHETRIEKLEAHASKLERENEELKQQIKELKGLTA